MPTTMKDFDPTQAKTAARRTSVWTRSVKPTLKVGGIYLQMWYDEMDPTKVLEDRALVTVIDRKTTGKVTTVAVIVVSPDRSSPPQIIRGLRVHNTDTEDMDSERINLYNGGDNSYQEWVYAHDRVTNL